MKSIIIAISLFLLVAFGQLPNTPQSPMAQLNTPARTLLNAVFDDANIIVEACAPEIASADFVTICGDSGLIDNANLFSRAWSAYMEAHGGDDWLPFAPWETQQTEGGLVVTSRTYSNESLNALLSIYYLPDGKIIVGYIPVE